jgi:hypothetical protein
MFEDDARFACDARFPTARVLRLIQERIAHYALDLKGLTVVTEAATGYYRVTATIAAVAGARKVLALARDTSFGPADAARRQTEYLAHRADVSRRLEVAFDRPAAVFEAADLVTNLGAVRPIDGWVVERLKPTAAVSLMFGGNDWRPQEVDLAACWQRGIAVAGVDEKGIELFRYTGLRILWFLLELGVEVVGCRLVLWGEGAVFRKVMAFLSQLGAEVLAISPEPAQAIQECGGRKVADRLDTASGWSTLRQADALLTFDPTRRRTFIGADGEIMPQALATAAPAIAVGNYSGRVDRSSLAAVGINCFPRHDPGGGHTANTIGEILPAPVIELHTAGLKVGEIMARARLQGCGHRVAEQAAVDTGLGQDLHGWYEWRMRAERGDAGAGSPPLPVAGAPSP